MREGDYPLFGDPESDNPIDRIKWRGHTLTIDVAGNNIAKIARSRNEEKKQLAVYGSDGDGYSQILMNKFSD